MSLVTKGVIVFTGSSGAQPIEVFGSSSAAEDSTASSTMSSSSHIPVPVEPDNSGKLKIGAGVSTQHITVQEIHT